MPPRRGVTVKDAVSQMLYACGGDKKQYEQTVDAIVGAVKTYVSQLAVVALRNGTSPMKVRPDDVIQALSCDPVKRGHVETNWKYKKDVKAATKDAA